MALTPSPRRASLHRLVGTALALFFGIVLTQSAAAQVAPPQTLCPAGTGLPDSLCEAPSVDPLLSTPDAFMNASQAIAVTVQPFADRVSNETMSGATELATGLPEGDVSVPVIQLLAVENATAVFTAGAITSTGDASGATMDASRQQMQLTREFGDRKAAAMRPDIDGADGLLGGCFFDQCLGFRIDGVVGVFIDTFTGAFVFDSHCGLLNTDCDNDTTQNELLTGRDPTRPDDPEA